VCCSSAILACFLFPCNSTLLHTTEQVCIYSHHTHTHTLSLSLIQPTNRGDQYFRLYDQSGAQVAFNDDACGGLCSQITYTTTEACQVYGLHQGCQGNTLCSGLTNVAGGGVLYAQFPTRVPTLAPTLSPSPLPTYLPGDPTPLPTLAPSINPMFAPTAAPTYTPLQCSPFNATDTAGDTQNFQTCGVYACPGTTITVSMCPTYGGGGCTGDPIMNLYDGTGLNLLAHNDDGPLGCGKCPQFTYSTSGVCQVYSIQQGCYQNSQCTGSAVIIGTPGSFSVLSYPPTTRPTLAPTAEPTTPPPTFGPSVAPSYLPGRPTPLPTAAPR